MSVEARGPKPPMKTAQVFETSLIGGEEYMSRPRIDWTAIHRELAKLSPQERTHSGILYSALNISGYDVPVFVMHSDFDPGFLSKIDEDNDKIEDLLSDSLEGPKLAYPTAFVPLSDRGALALCKGTQSAPGREDVQNFINRVLRKNENEHYQVTQVVSSARVKEFQAASRARAFNAIFATDSSFDAVELAEDTLVGALQKIAKDAGLSLKVSLDIQLEKMSNNRKGQEAFYGLAKNSAPIAQDMTSKASVTTVDHNNMDHELNLVAEKLGVKFELSSAVSETRSFSALVTGLVKAIPEIKERLPQGL